MAGLLLAAGQGSRLGRPKALVELAGQTLAARGVALLKDGGADPVVVVSGAAELHLPGVIMVRNPGWATGMASSLRAGLAALPGDSDAVVIALVDQPLIGPESVRRLIAAHTAGAGAAVACYEGRPRNPVMIARGHWAAVASAAVGEAGARAFLRARPDLVTLVECGDTGRPDDIDTERDLKRIEGLLAARQPRCRLQARREVSGPDRLGDKHPEQVEIGRFLVGEHADLVPRATCRVEDLESLLGPDQAHGAVDVLADRVSARWDGRLGSQLGEDPLGWHPPPGCPASPRGGHGGQPGLGFGVRGAGAERAGPGRVDLVAGRG